MHAYPESAFGDVINRSKEEILIVGLNWLGDSIMSMPAIQAYRRAWPEMRLAMLVKPALAELWPMHPAIDETFVCSESIPETWKTASQIRGRHFSAAYILPQSFRSALIPFLAQIPQRIGLRGHFRSGLLTKTALLPRDAAGLHQQYEYMSILGQKAIHDELPALRINPVHLAKAEAMLGRDKQPWIGLIPGAARGAAKRWPENYFTAAAKILKKQLKCNFVLFGSNADKESCARITAAAGDCVLNLAGQTSLPELAALMSRCAAVIGNDSGGMHMAAAAGAPVIVVFGITSPAKTKPLGSKVVVLQDSPVAARDVPRNSGTAEKSLKNISPEMAAEAVRGVL